MSRQTIKQLLGEIADLKKLSDSNFESAREWRRRSEEHEASLKEARSHFANLKEKLHNAETENARLNGYLERVREDDRVVDPLVEVEDQAGKRLVSKRHPTPIMSQHGAAEYLETAMLNRNKPKHWMSY